MLGVSSSIVQLTFMNISCLKKVSTDVTAVDLRDAQERGRYDVYSMAAED